jgi:hypothetical protein
MDNMNSERGRIEKIKLKKFIKINSYSISKARAVSLKLG